MPKAIDIERYPSLKGLAAVNEQINQVPYAEDLKQYGIPDHWTGIETGNGKDCEDYAIVKANALEKVGWPREGLCLAIVYTEKSPFPDHGILAVSAPDQPSNGEENLLFLDNRIPGLLTRDDLIVRGYRPFIIQTGGTLEWREWKPTKI